ncbi:MAG: isoaspartyl peptidase/L-asparaginase [Planctomycetaceae bacterium]|nr:isoaspartyl peptidase/L-asparaginase [Planctomycetaceae bacterium]
MSRIWVCVLMSTTAVGFAADRFDPTVPDVVLGIHGGIGDADQELAPEVEKEMRAAMELALRNGHALLKQGKPSLDAVEAAIRVLEDSPQFNAGRGAVFTNNGTNELDASIMDGKTKQAGAVAGVMVVKNPITAARAVMEKSKHVLLTQRGAEQFAKEQGLEIVDPKYFRTEHRWKALQERIEKDKQQQQNPPAQAAAFQRLTKVEYGTVGAVAIDQSGNLAAGTSTGGMTNKMYNRLGDSPIIGAGTYAENGVAAISCTGHGEFFIRYAVSHEIVAQMKYKGVTALEAADDVINKQLPSAFKRKPDDAEGAAIVLDKNGGFTTAYNYPALFRGYITKDGTVRVRLNQK